VGTAYFIELESFHLSTFRETLETGDVLPSRKILKEDLATRFGMLESQVITKLSQLMDCLKTDDKLKSFSEKTGLPEEYLTILRREVNSFLPKPRSLAEIPALQAEHLSRLNKNGIRQTKQLFERVRTAEQRTLLAQECQVPEQLVLELAKLSDLTRINGVGAIFARILYETGVNTIELMAQADAKTTFNKVLKINEEKHYTEARVTLKDIQYCIDYAKKLPKGIEW
jgi:hypothetical protein